MSVVRSEVIDDLEVHLQATQAGLQGVLDLVGPEPGDRVIRAASVRALLLPLADEASQAVPLVQLLRA